MMHDSSRIFAEQVRFYLLRLRGACFAVVLEHFAPTHNSGIGGNLWFKTADNAEILQDRMVIDKTGKVGIGLVPNTHMLDVAGTVASNGFALASDRRLKKNIHYLGRIMHAPFAETIIVAEMFAVVATKYNQSIIQLTALF